MVKNKKLLGGFFLAIFTVLGFLGLSPAQAEAATLNVNSTCTLPKAVNAVQNAADDADCIKTGAAYGTNDTVSLPAGTITLTTDLATITKPVTISGASKTSTVINAAGNKGIYASYNAAPIQHDITVQNLTVTNAVPLGVFVLAAETVTLSNVDINNSQQAVVIIDAQNATITDSDIHDNSDPSTSGPTGSGIYVRLKGLTSTDSPSVNISDTVVADNSSLGGENSAGVAIFLQENTQTDTNVNVASKSILLHHVAILRNQAGLISGLYINEAGGPSTTVDTELLIDSTTVAYNTVTVPTPVTINQGDSHLPVLAGIFISGKLTEQQNFTNTTVAYNTVDNPAPDNRNTIAGFFGTNSIDGAALRITNATVVGNVVDQPGREVEYPAFVVIRVSLDLSEYPTVTITDVINGSSSQNSLIANNKQNGTFRNCYGAVDLAPFNFNGTIDATPTNLGTNLTDDNSCTGYTSVANLYDTIEHEVKDNGGPVPTIALLPGSPAINGGSAVLGISTDARGVARTGYVSVGAYQGVLLAASTTNTNGGGTLAETGIVAISAGALLAIFVIGLSVVYADYRRHKKPLKAVDPKVQYGFIHHVNVVTLPLLRYRLFIRVLKKNPYSASGVHKF